MSDQYTVYDERVADELLKMARDTTESILKVQEQYPGVSFGALLNTLAHRAATVATNAALGHPLDRRHSNSKEAEVRREDVDGEAVKLLRRIADANVIFPSMCANNVEAWNLTEDLKKWRSTTSSERT